MLSMHKCSGSNRHLRKAWPADAASVSFCASLPAQLCILASPAATSRHTVSVSLGGFGYRPVLAQQEATSARLCINPYSFKAN